MKFARTADLIRASEEVACVVVGTEAERSEAAEVVSALAPDVRDLVGRTSVGVLAAILERCSVLIANDGGVAHLAAAVGTPVVTPFGPSNDRAWRPLTAKVVSVDLPCRPCFYRDFERGLPGGCATRECLTQISPGMVARATLEILQRQTVAS